MSDIKFNFFGDLCVKSGYFPYIDPRLKKQIIEADISSINFEAPVIDAHFKPASKIGPVISQPSTVIKNLESLGFNLFVLANNHIMDYGYDGLRKTISEVNSATVGAALNFCDVYKPHIIDIKGKKIAFFALSEAQFGGVMANEPDMNFGYACIDHPLARSAILKYSQLVDFTLVQVHAGLEMVELPLPEWREKYKELIDLGADIVVGHHPHVIQGGELYKDKMIYYSLGNFYMDIMDGKQKNVSGGFVQVVIDENGLRSNFHQLVIEERGVSLSESISDDKFSGLSDFLQNYQKYLDAINQICINFWVKYYSIYYEDATNGLGVPIKFKNIYKVVRKIILNFFRGRKNDVTFQHLMLIHNIRTESHRWVVDRALRKILGGRDGT